MTTLSIGDHLVVELPEGAAPVEAGVDESRHVTPQGLSVVTRVVGPFADREMALKVEQAHVGELVHHYELYEEAVRRGPLIFEVTHSRHSQALILELGTGGSALAVMLIIAGILTESGQVAIVEIVWPTASNAALAPIAQSVLDSIALRPTTP